MYCRSLQMQYSTWCERNTQSWPAAPHCYTRVTKAWRASSWPEVWHHFNRPVNYLSSSIRGEKAPLSLYVSSECGALYEIFSTLSPVKNQQTKMHINQKEFKEQSKTKMIYRQWRFLEFFFFFENNIKGVCIFSRLVFSVNYNSSIGWFPWKVQTLRLCGAIGTLLLALAFNQLDIATAQPMTWVWGLFVWPIAGECLGNLFINSPFIWWLVQLTLENHNDHMITITNGVDKLTKINI